MDYGHQVIHVPTASYVLCPSRALASRVAVVDPLPLHNGQGAYSAGSRPFFALSRMAGAAARSSIIRSKKVA